MRTWLFLSTLERIRHEIVQGRANLRRQRGGMEAACQVTRGRRNAPPVESETLKMKITKSAAKAALKPNEKPTVKSTASSAAGTSAALTTIDVKRDVGFGNAVFLRGQGAGLTWERGLPLVCVDAQTWRWSGMAKDPIKFKLLINDTIWSAGNDLMIAPGQKMEVAPDFV